MHGGALYLLVDPVGSEGTFLTDPILVGSGDSVTLRVGSRLALSSYFVRGR